MDPYDFSMDTAHLTWKFESIDQTLRSDPRYQIIVVLVPQIIPNKTIRFIIEMYLGPMAKIQVWRGPDFGAIRGICQVEMARWSDYDHSTCLELSEGLAAIATFCAEDIVNYPVDNNSVAQNEIDNDDEEWN